MILLNIIQMSVAAAVLIVLILTVRLLAAHRIPRSTYSLLWTIALLRLIVPLSLPPLLRINAPSLDISRRVTILIEDALKAAADDQRSPEAGAEAETEAEIMLPGEELPMAQVNTYPPLTEKHLSSAQQTSPAVSSKRASTAPLFIALWVTGMAACALFFLTTHLRCRNGYKTATPVVGVPEDSLPYIQNARRNVRIKESTAVNAPMTYGLLKPVILLPGTFCRQDEAALRYVLMHEFNHIKRLDVLTKWLLAAALCVHWFNPLVWILYIFSCRDMELSCDEKVISALGITSRSSYALTLINLEENKSKFAPLLSYFAKNAVEERIVSIMKYKKARALSKILSVLLICAVIAVFTLGASQAAGAALKPDETQGSGVSQKIGDAQETDALHGTEVSQLPGSLWRSDDAKEHDITHGTGTTRVTGTVQEAGFLQESGDAQETGSAYKAPVGGFSIEQTEALPFSGEFGRVSAIEPPGLLILMCNLDNRVGYLIYYSAPDPLLTTREHVSSVQAEMMSAARAVWYDFPLFAADDHDSLELLEMELNKAIMHFSDESVRVDHVSLWLLNTPRRLQFGD